MPKFGTNNFSKKSSGGGKKTSGGSFKKGYKSLGGVKGGSKVQLPVKYHGDSEIKGR